MKDARSLGEQALVEKRKDIGMHRKSLRDPAYYFLQTADLESVFSILALHYRQAGHPSMGGTWSLRDLEIELEKGFGLGLFGPNYLLKAFILYRKCDWGADITLLATHPQSVGQGYMTQLLNELAALLPPPGRMGLEVHEDNEPARRLYMKFGFKFASRRPRYYRDGKAAFVYFYGALKKEF